MTVVPITEIGRRLPQAGRIRLGHKTPKGAPQALDKFRFTAPKIAPLEAIAAMYGGTPRSWAEPKSDDAFELYSEASQIEVVLPPNAYDASYELWAGRGIQRRCTAVTCTLQVPGADGPEQVERDCICNAQGFMECKLKQRLNVILPDISFFGFWRMDTSSEYAARELPGMIKAIVTVDGGTGMTRALLGIEKRHDVVETSRGVQRRNYVVPVIGFAATFNEIAAGAARVSVTAGAAPLAAPPTGVTPRELAPGAPSDDEIADAEIVDEDIPIDEVCKWLARLTPREQSRILGQARKVASELGEPIPTNFSAITGRTLETIWRALNT